MGNFLFIFASSCSITVTFSVNNTVDADEEEIEGAEQQEPQEAAQVIEN